jgi:hypothetical protein
VTTEVDLQRVSHPATMTGEFLRVVAIDSVQVPVAGGRGGIPGLAASITMSSFQVEIVGADTKCRPPRRLLGTH